ncbi:MAG: mechanosensitive ion channel family protein, partial [Cyanobacteria bacterium]|nr:mechanosensitive ion channel family protein [Cyanobacteriota bacterium]
MNLSNYWESAITWLFTVGLQMVIIVAMMVIALKGTDFVSKRVSKIFKRGKEQTELRKRADTLSSVIRYILTVIVYGIGGMMLLQKINVNVGPLLAGAGVIGVAIGFGAQDLVKDLISGLYILLEDQIRVGDVVEIAGKSGMVERVTLRTVVLRDQAGSVHYIRNAKIDTVKNMTKDFSFHVFEIPVGYNEDADRVVQILEELGAELEADPAYSDDIIAPIEIFGLDKIGDSSLTIKGRIKTRPIKQWKVGREFNRRLKKRFVELGIAPPSTVQAVQMMPAVPRVKEEKALQKVAEPDLADPFVAPDTSKSTEVDSAAVTMT